MLKLKVGYPNRNEEREILDRMASTTPQLNVKAVTTLEAISEAREHVNDVYVDPKIETTSSISSSQHVNPRNLS